MTYREIQSLLSIYRARGHNVPPLNSKKAVLQAALNQIEGGYNEKAYRAAAKAYDNVQGDMSQLPPRHIRLICQVDGGIPSTTLKSLNKTQLLNMWFAVAVA